ncbi:HNH endonuclease [Herbiconiux sp. CPCC 205716]|uniref:HNH endonuclease n=1 Tax=Herbiconiux gentiana TaxID=2970912 RepID=A0ABT2GJ83_9MICO|nr:HNH endonuclease signature motif containing protein [Herbiconiux gentiana]MCS5716283.1 HNH endonuclease [Herbiconiux gentiana]
MIRREQARLEAKAVRVLAAAARKANLLAGLPGSSLEHARRSLVTEVATTLRVPEATAARRIDEAETLSDSLPSTLALLANGDIDYPHAQAVVRQARTLPESARGEFESAALDKADSQTPSQLASHARLVRERMHPESIDARHREAREERAVWLEKERDGMATLVCHLPAVAAYAIDDTLDQLGRALRSPEETRTHAQLRADGLVELLLHRDGDTSARARGITANINLTVPVMALLDRGAGAVDPVELVGYGPIDLETARRMAAGATSFLRILTDPITGRRLSVGRDRYKVPADLRAAVVLDDETCRFPGCVRRADRCDLDHTSDWAHGGETGLDNLAALCRRHHTVKHQTDWTVQAGEGRALHWTSPSGARHTTRPPDRGAGHGQAGPLRGAPQVQSPAAAVPSSWPSSPSLTSPPATSPSTASPPGAPARPAPPIHLPDRPPF